MPDTTLMRMSALVEGTNDYWLATVFLRRVRRHAPGETTADTGVPLSTCQSCYDAIIGAMRSAQRA
jgi:hypothetical protein